MAQIPSVWAGLKERRNTLQALVWLTLQAQLKFCDFTDLKFQDMRVSKKSISTESLGCQGKSAGNRITFLFEPRPVGFFMYECRTFVLLSNPMTSCQYCGFLDGAVTDC